VDIQVPHDDFDKEELKELWGFQTIPIFFVKSKKGETSTPMKWESLKEFVIQ
jgi:hypothetical protein